MKGWERKPIGEICEVIAGQSPEGKFYNEEGKGFPFYQGKKDFGEKYIQVPRVWTTFATKIACAGDILMSVRAPVGPINFTNEKICIGRGLAAIRVSSQIDREFLFYFLLAYQPQIKGNEGAVFASINKNQIESISIPLPPMSEQQRIVALLDEAFAGLETLRANAEKNVQNARELFDSYLNLVLAGNNQWTDMAFDEFCAIDSKLVDPREPTYLDLPHIGAGNMVSRTGEIIDVLTAREEGLISGKFFFDSRMVLYSKIRPYLMKACRPDFDGLCSADVYPLLPKPGIIDRNFLFYLLMTRRFTDYAIEGSARAGMPKVNREHLFAYPCKLPNLKEQRALAKALDSLQDDCTRLKSIFENKLAAIDELKQSILHQAFSGQLIKSEGVAA